MLVYTDNGIADPWLVAQTAIRPRSAWPLDVRLGGIYALERLAVDSERDHSTVVEVLSALTRERSKPPEEPIGIDTKPAPATDVQAAIAVLGRLPARADVSRGDLLGAHLTGARLDRANLNGAYLDGRTDQRPPQWAAPRRGDPGRRREVLGDRRCWSSLWRDATEGSGLTRTVTGPAAGEARPGP